MVVVPIYAFLWYLGKVPDFHGENSVTCHLTFAAKIRHHFALDDTDCDSHTERGRAGIYTYIMHNASTQSKKVNSYTLEHDPKYRCRKVNRSHHTLEMGTNGTRHDIPNTTHLREKGGRKEGGLKEYITKWERLDP